MRRLAVLFVAAALAGGCGKAPPTTVRVALAADPGMSADTVTLTVYDRNGRVIDAAKLAGTAKLPGDVVVMMSAEAGEARALAIGWSGGVAVGEAAGRAPVVPGHEGRLAMQLSLGMLPDADGDGVPDVIDNCPNAPNAAQSSTYGNVLGDACGGNVPPDLGSAPPGSDMAGGGGTDDLGGVVVPAGCGNGVLEAGEQCDTGSANSDDPAANATCTSMCKLRASCGSVAGAVGAKVDPATGHCYIAWNGPLNWETAQHDCQSRGGTLAVISSAGEDALVSGIAGAGTMWIGLEITHGTTDTFRWVDGTTTIYAPTAWAPGQPDNGGGSRPEECGARTALGWADFPCGFPATGSLPSSVTFALGYVCETGCGNGVVEPGEECDPPGASCTASCMMKRTCTESGGVVSPVNGHCYFAVNNSVKFSTALTSCPAGTHLATLDDMSENDAGMMSIAALGNDAWIALEAPSTLGQYSWQVPTTETFLSRRWHGFAGAEPNENSTPNCVRASYGYGWRDISCNNNYATMCERE